MKVGTSTDSTDPKYPTPEDMGWQHDDLDDAVYCECCRPLLTEKEQRDGVCRECL